MTINSRRTMVGSVWRLLAAVTVAAIVTVTTALPAGHKLEVGGDATAMIYLFNYGYMRDATNPNSGALLSEDAMRTALIDFQAFAGLNQTGLLDGETKEMMNRPRCGNEDRIGHGANTRRRKRYALQGSRWRIRALTYKVSKYPSLLKRSDVDREVSRAFKVWEDVTTLTFSEATTGKVNIDIRFEKGEHGDGDPFDGRGGTLAHAYFPIYGGDAHFDDTERWTIASYTGTNLFQVAAHEFGHSLGLSHSDVREALMAPFYKSYERNFKLANDDTRAIQVLYGKKTDSAVTTTQRPKSPTNAPPSSAPPSVSALCRNSKIDAIVTMGDTNTYVFKGSQYYKLTDDSTAPGYPKAIAANWDGLASNVNAAFTWVNGKTYFFKGSQYWRYTNMSLDADYPKPISKGFAGIPNDVDAAFVWSGNGKIYFFKGSKYWRFDPTKRPPVKENYPKDISNWDGVPNNIDDALQYSNGFTYFFKAGQYWRFNDRAFRIDSADPPFPRPVGVWWFGCKASGSMTQVHTPRAQEMQSTDYDVHEDTFDAEGSSQESSPNAFRPRFDTGMNKNSAHPPMGSMDGYNSAAGPTMTPVSSAVKIFTAFVVLVPVFSRHFTCTS